MVSNHKEQQGLGRRPQDVKQPSEELMQGTMMTRPYIGGQGGNERKGGVL